MKTRMFAGIFRHPESGLHYEIVRNDEPSLGWLAYELRDISVRVDSGGARTVTPLRKSGAEPQVVLLELWLELEMWLPDYKAVEETAVSAVAAWTEARRVAPPDDGAVTA